MLYLDQSRNPTLERRRFMTRWWWEGWAGAEQYRAIPFIPKIRQILTKSRCSFLFSAALIVWYDQRPLEPVKSSQTKVQSYRHCFICHPGGPVVQHLVKVLVESAYGNHHWRGKLQYWSKYIAMRRLHSSGAKAIPCVRVCGGITWVMMPLHWRPVRLLFDHVLISVVFSLVIPTLRLNSSQRNNCVVSPSRKPPIELLHHLRSFPS